MDLFDNAGANAGFGALAFGTLATVAIIAGFKFRWLRFKTHLAVVFISVLLVTVNSSGILGEIAGALREVLNNSGERVITETTGTEVTSDPPRTEVTSVSAGGALLGLCGITWYTVKIFAAKGRKLRELPEIIMGTGAGICYGTSLGFMGSVVGATVLTANNVGLYLFGG